MAKKLLIALILALLVLGSWGLFYAYQSRLDLRQQRQIAKAPDISITLLEGWNNKQIADYLQTNSIASSQDFLAATKNFDPTSYLDISGRPKDAGLEGFIFPDTYFLPKNPASGTNVSELIIIKALDNFSQKVTPKIQAQAALNGLSLYQLVTMASVLEKESKGDATEKATIAGIFFNRLKAGIPLQADSTVTYFTGKNPISADDIKIDNPYNTYEHSGLPPGPICNPSLASIIAAANPITSDYYYFLTNPKTGQAVYAKTYDEHLVNIQKYLR